MVRASEAESTRVARGGPTPRAARPARSQGRETAGLGFLHPPPDHHQAGLLQLPHPTEAVYAAGMPYGWPVKPFAKQHPVRGYLNDPRIQGPSRAFHFGIDVAAPDGTRVYAVEPGKAFVEGRLTVAVAASDREFGYWHIVPAVDHHQRVARHELLGRVAKGWGHVHFAERRRGVYLNPLRRGGIEPYVDHTSPTIVAIRFARGVSAVSADRVTGIVDIVVEAFDTPPLPVPAPWNDMPVSPMRLRWRILRAGSVVSPWRVGLDFAVHLKNDGFHTVYAKGSRQNRPNRPGRYCYLVACDWDSRSLHDGEFRLQVEAADSRENIARAARWFTVA